MAVAWSALDDTATQLTGINETEQFFDKHPQNLPNQYTQIQVTGVGTPGGTDDLIVSIYDTLASGSGYSSVPFKQFNIATTSGGETEGIIVTELYEFQVGVKSAGNTDVQVADLKFRTATMS